MQDDQLIDVDIPVASDEPAPEMIDEEVSRIRRPPQSVESEQAILGGLLMDNRAFDQISDLLMPEDFYRRDHRLIFEQISALIVRSNPADVVTVYGELERQGLTQDTGGLPYLNSLVDSTPSAANIKRYAEVVRERSLLHQLITAGDEIATMGFNPSGSSVEEILDQAQSKVFSINERSSKGKNGFVSIDQLSGEVTRELEELSKIQSRDDVTGLPTGLFDLDRMTSGLQPGDLIIVAGRPSMGKTSFAMNLAEYAGISLKMPVAVFSMEMSSVSLAKRLISSIGRIDAQKMRRAKLDDADWKRYVEVVARMGTAPFYIDDTPALTVNELRARTRRLERQVGKLSLIVVDYLQLMSGSAKSANENRATEISEISRGLKGLAKELKVPVIALSQLNRSVDSRTDRRPVMSDLRESGAIEQDADIIMFIYRDEVYNKDTADKNVAEIIIGKQRNGPTGTVRLRFDGQFTRFDNLTNEPPPPGYE